MKRIVVELTVAEYAGLVQFLKQRENDIEDDQEDLGLLQPLLTAYKSRVIWTEMKPWTEMNPE